MAGHPSGSAPGNGAEHRTRPSHPDPPSDRRHAPLMGGMSLRVANSREARTDVALTHKGPPAARPSTGARPEVDHAQTTGQCWRMNQRDLGPDATPLVAQVSRALRVARKRRGLSQRELAQQIGVSKSRLARLESDAGPQSLEMVCQVLMASGFRLEVTDASGSESSAGSPRSLLELTDAGGRRFPAHLAAHRSGYPPPYWFVRNGGWNTSKAFPEWTYERRPPAQTSAPKARGE